MAPITNIIYKYKEHYNLESNTDVIDESNEVDNILEILDNKIPKYNKYTANNPMLGVSWDCNRKAYKTLYGKYNSYIRDLDTACEKIKDIFCDNFSEKISKFITKDFFTYCNYYFVCFWENEKPYFDIQHIISTLNLKKSSWNIKYNDFKNDIQYYTCHQNKHGGYIFRELITEQTMYEIILSSNSVISKSFKKDVSNILVDLRKSGKLKVSNEKIEVNIDDEPVNIEPIHRTYKFNNLEDRLYAKELIRSGSLFPIAKYMDHHVLYSFIIKIPGNSIIMKFGYSEDIVDRIKSLRCEYKCNVFFVRAKLINRRKDETRFHSLLKNKYPHLIKKYHIGNKDKVELYKFNPILMQEYDDYMNELEINDLEEPDKLSKEVKKLLDSVKKQQLLFTDQELANNQLVPINSDMYFKYLIQKEKSYQEREKTIRKRDRMIYEKDKMKHEYRMAKLRHNL